MDSAAQALGSWIGGLESWTHMLTYTHDPERLESKFGHSRVGPQRDARLAKKWWEYVTSVDPHAALWREVEFHQSGAVHAHALAKFSRNAPVLSFRQAWFDAAGFMVVEPVASAVAAGAYITKRCGIYIAKQPTIAPMVRGVRVRDAFGRSGDR